MQISNNVAYLGSQYVCSEKHASVVPIRSYIPSPARCIAHEPVGSEEDGCELSVEIVSYACRDSIWAVKFLKGSPARIQERVTVFLGLSDG